MNVLRTLYGNQYRLFFPWVRVVAYWRLSVHHGLNGLAYCCFTNSFDTHVLILMCEISFNPP